MTLEIVLFERSLINWLPFREISNLFVNNFQKYFTVGENVTVDEQLLAFLSDNIFLANQLNMA